MEAEFFFPPQFFIPLSLPLSPCECHYFLVARSCSKTLNELHVLYIEIYRYLSIEDLPPPPSTYCHHQYYDLEMKDEDGARGAVGAIGLHLEGK